MRAMNIPEAVTEAVEQLESACAAFLLVVPDDYDPHPDDGDLCSLRTLVRNAEAGARRWRDRLVEIEAEMAATDPEVEG